MMEDSVNGSLAHGVDRLTYRSYDVLQTPRGSQVTLLAKFKAVVKCEECMTKAVTLFLFH